MTKKQLVICIICSVLFIVFLMFMAFDLPGFFASFLDFIVFSSSALGVYALLLPHLIGKEEDKDNTYNLILLFIFPLIFSMLFAFGFHYKCEDSKLHLKYDKLKSNYIEAMKNVKHLAEDEYHIYDSDPFVEAFPNYREYLDFYKE